MVNNLTRVYIIWIITWSLAMVVGNNKIGYDKKSRQIGGNFDHHTFAAVRCRTHRPMEHFLGFTRYHWMLPSGECLRLIAPAAAMVDNFVVKDKRQNTNKKLLLASKTYGS